MNDQMAPRIPTEQEKYNKQLLERLLALLAGKKGPKVVLYDRDFSVATSGAIRPHHVEHLCNEGYLCINYHYGDDGEECVYEVDSEGYCWVNDYGPIEPLDVWRIFVTTDKLDALRGLR